MLPFFLQVDNLYAVDSLYLSATKRLMLFTMWVLWSVICGTHNFAYLLHLLLRVGRSGCPEELLGNVVYGHCCGVYKVVAIEAVVTQVVDHDFVRGEVSDTLWVALLKLLDANSEECLAQRVIL